MCTALRALVCALQGENEDGELIVLRSRQNESATIKEIPAWSANSFELTGIKLKPDLEFVIAHGDRVPKYECPFSLELQPEIHAGGFAVFDREAPHPVQL